MKQNIYIIQRLGLRNTTSTFVVVNDEFVYDRITHCSQPENYKRALIIICIVLTDVHRTKGTRKKSNAFLTKQIQLAAREIQNNVMKDK